MGRSPCCPKHSVLHRGAWTLQEDLVLSEYITSHGEGRWRSLPQKAGLKRCGKSCRLRWLNYLRPDIKRGDISPDEEDLIVRLHRLLGNRWSLIAGRLPNRTDNEIKNYWNTHLGKKIMTENVTLSKQTTESRPALTAPDRVVKSTPVKAKPVRLVKGHNKYLAAGNSNCQDLNSIHPEPTVHTSASAEELLVQELTTELDSDFTMWKYIPELGSPSIEINGHFNFPCMPNLVELQSPPSQPCAKNDVNTSDNLLYLNGDLPSLDYDLLCSPWNSAEDFKIDELEVSLTHELAQRWCYSIQNNVSPVNKSLTDEQEIDINPEEAHWVDGLHCLPNSSIHNFTEF